MILSIYENHILQIMGRRKGIMFRDRNLSYVWNCDDFFAVKIFLIKLYLSLECNEGIYQSF